MGEARERGAFTATWWVISAVALAGVAVIALVQGKWLIGVAFFVFAACAFALARRRVKQRHIW